MSQVESTLDRPWAPAEPPADRLPSLLRPLRNRNYALLFTGQFSSLVGDQLYVVALPFLVLGRASVRDLGLVLMCFGLARIAAIPLGGVLADRMDRSKLMLLTDVGRALCVAGNRRSGLPDGRLDGAGYGADRGPRRARRPVPALVLRDPAGRPERRRAAGRQRAQHGARERGRVHRSRAWRAS